MRYRRVKIPGTRYFLTINLAERKNTLLTDNITQLINAFNDVKLNHPFNTDAFVILPDHLHIIMSLPSDDANYSQRLNLIKGYFSRKIKVTERVSISLKRKRERGIWQRRFWEHCIRDENDFEKHVNYIHYNPVKHGYVKQPVDWRYSSIHRYVAKGILRHDGCSHDNT